MKEKIILALIFIAFAAIGVFISVTITKAIWGSNMPEWLKVWLIAS